MKIASKSGVRGKVKVVDDNSGTVRFDAFNRLEVANPLSLGDYIFKYDLQPLLFDTSIVGSGSVTHLPNESSVRLRVTTANSDKATLNSRRYHRYQAGRAGKVVLTGIIGAGKVNVRKRWGFFDDDNGLFFELNGTTFSVVQRSSTSGSVVDNTVSQSSFNGDTVDSTGDSGFNLDLSLGNIFEIDFQWLGTGVASFKVVQGNGTSIELHHFLNPNLNASVYMSTAVLPIRYEIENIGTSASQTDMIAICSSVVSSAGDILPELSFADGNGSVITTTNANETHVCSFRLAQTFNSVNNRMEVFPKNFNFSSDRGSCIFKVYLNATITGGSWVSTNTNSGVQTNTSATFSSAGNLILVIPNLNSTGNPQQVGRTFHNQSGTVKTLLTRSADNTTSDIITITVQRLTATNVDAMVSMEWTELR